KSEFKNHNCGIPCGPANGIIVADVDDRDRFEAYRKRNGLDLPETRTHQTGSGTPHYVYQYPQNGKRYGCRSLKKWGFDIRGIGGQVVAPGSIHPDTGKPYTVLKDLPIAPAPQWLLGLALHEDTQPQTSIINDKEVDLESLPYATKNLIQNGVAKGDRSEAIASVLTSLVRTDASDDVIFAIFNKYPIGEKYLEKDSSKDRWLQGEIDRIRKFVDKNNPNKGPESVAARVREYLDSFDGGTFRISDLKRELNLNDKAYTVARNCVVRMIKEGVVQKCGQQLGSYRVVDKKKNAIVWDEIEAKPCGVILPGKLNDVVTIRSGDVVCFAGFKNQDKTAIAIETVRLNLDKFKIHLFITEYPARMKRRLLDFGIDLNHPNLKCYQVDRSDYIPDKIEPGEGVLNVIDHFPNLDQFYLVGKYQDEIHRALDGAVCVITHQKKDAKDLDAIGGSFWTITPTLAVTLFRDGDDHKMKIRKGKEPGKGIYDATNMSIGYKLKKGCEFEYDKRGWK
ncbi:MAG: bifunctional DNA primase/polymerase, partial [Deltaproteobacteria bacterium]|nr:bifunctional DNA primase/polymerase [Deltaproteobacteria bacterium]